MSDFPAEALGYQAVVAELFLALRGSGLLLSPLDQELVAEWERRGLPVPVVCRGLRRGAADLAEERGPPPRSLRALRFAVEDEWRAYQSGRVGDSPPPPGEEEAAARRLARAGELLVAAARAGGPLRAAYLEAGARLRLAPAAAAGSPLEGLDAALAELDARLLSAWLASLPRPERSGLGRRLQLLVGARPPGESRRARREGLRTHLLELARQAGLTCLRGSV